MLASASVDRDLFRGDRFTPDPTHLATTKKDHDMPTAPVVNTLSSRYWQGRQSWEYEELLEVGGHRLRVRIDCDSYDFQSSAVCERWDGNAWREVSRLAGQAMNAQHGDSVNRGPVNYTAKDLNPAARAAFEADRNILVAEAKLVLGLAS